MYHSTELPEDNTFRINGGKTKLSDFEVGLTNVMATEYALTYVLPCSRLTLMLDKTNNR
jgi:hypothetical protein